MMLLLWLLKLGLLILLFLAYWIVNSEGLRIVAPFFGKKLYKVPVPGFSLLEDYEWSHRLDAAHVMAVLFFVLTMVLTVLFVRCVVFGQPPSVRVAEGSEEFCQLFLLGLAVSILFIDTALFYFGAASLSGGIFGGGFSVTALFLALGYCVMLLGMAVLHVILSPTD